MAYDDDRISSETQRQAAHKTAVTQADHTTADINHYTRLLAAECKWGISNGALTALRSLGQSPVAVPANTSGVAGFNPS